MPLRTGAMQSHMNMMMVVTGMLKRAQSLVRTTLASVFTNAADILAHVFFNMPVQKNSENRFAVRASKGLQIFPERGLI